MMYPQHISPFKEDLEDITDSWCIDGPIGYHYSGYSYWTRVQKIADYMSLTIEEQLHVHDATYICMNVDVFKNIKETVEIGKEFKFKTRLDFDNGYISNVTLGELNIGPDYVHYFYEDSDCEEEKIYIEYGDVGNSLIFDILNYNL